MTLDKKLIQSFPSQPGVYFFLQKNYPIYIGKASNLKSRIISHFKNSEIDQKEKLIIHQSDRIKIISTKTDFEAALLEAEMIKKYQPKFNFRWKDDKNFLYIKMTINDEFPKVFIVRKENDGRSLYYGPFSSQNFINSILRDIRKVIPFCTQKKIAQSPCFYSKIGLCKPCPNQIINMKKKGDNQFLILKKEYQNNIKKLKKVFERKFDLIISQLEKKLKRVIKEEKYEEGIILRNKIFILNNLINNNFSYKNLDDNEVSDFDDEMKIFLAKNFSLKNYQVRRIECYDVSNLFGDKAVGAMVVFINGIPDKSQYRKFKIKKVKKISDTDMIKEILTRRFKKKDWPHPDLIIIDGGKPQLIASSLILNQNGLNIPIIGLAKTPDRIVIGFKKTKTIYLKENSPFLNLLKRIRDESHRFAKNYHLFLRKKVMYN